MRVRIALLVLGIVAVLGIMTWLPRLALDERVQILEDFLSGCASIPCLNDTRVCIDLVLNASSPECEGMLHNATRECASEVPAHLARHCEPMGGGLFFQSYLYAYLVVFGSINALCVAVVGMLYDSVRAHQCVLAEMERAATVSRVNDEDRSPTLELEAASVDTGPDTFADADAEPDPHPSPGDQPLFTIDDE